MLARTLSVNLEWSIVYIEGSQVVSCYICNVFIYLKIGFVIANSVDPYETLLYSGVNMGIHCLSNNAFRSN